MSLSSNATDGWINYAFTHILGIPMITRSYQRSLGMDKKRPNRDISYTMQLNDNEISSGVNKCLTRKYVLAICLLAGLFQLQFLASTFLTFGLSGGCHVTFLLNVTISLVQLFLCTLLSSLSLSLSHTHTHKHACSNERATII